jgi:hypothetical protein
MNVAAIHSVTALYINTFVYNFAAARTHLCESESSAHETQNARQQRMSFV